jgi:dTDP-4-dehydrorhamnose reductase
MASAKKILLTGVTGQVGTELYAVLQNIGEVVPTIAPGEKFAGAALTMDLCDPNAITRVVHEVKPDIIVNPAAYTAVDKAETDRELTTAINSAAPGILAQLAHQTKATLIHYSTDYVYPGQGECRYTEESATGPLNHYGASKLEGDQAVMANGESCLIFRTSWVYGIIGNNFVKTMLKLGKDRPTLKVINDQIGAPTFARTLADITAMILAQGGRDLYHYGKTHRGVYHLVNGGETSWWQFACKIFELARLHGYEGAVQEVLPISTAEYPTPAKRPHNSRLNCDKLGEHFGLRPSHWEAALAWAMPQILRQMS